MGNINNDWGIQGTIFKCFLRTEALITADFSDDDKICPLAGLQEYSIPTYNSTTSTIEEEHVDISAIQSMSIIDRLQIEQAQTIMPSQENEDDDDNFHDEENDMVEDNNNNENNNNNYNNNNNSNNNNNNDNNNNNNDNNNDNNK